MQHQALDDLDLRLIHALQISPRARWAALAPILGADSVTLARRWTRLHEEGIAWVAASPGEQLRGPSAIIEVECHPAATLRIASQIASDGEAFTVDLTAGGRELLVLVTAPDMAKLTSYIIERLPSLEGLRTTRTHLLSAAFSEAAQWRLRALGPRDITSIEQSKSGRADPRTRLDVDLEVQLFHRLGLNGRATVSAMADDLGVSHRRVRDSLGSMLNHGRLVMRTHVAKDYSGWPVHAWYFLRVPSAVVGRVGSSLARLGEIRVAVTTLGQHNVALAVWMRTLTDVQRLEVMIEEKLPGVSIADRSVVLRTVKNMGHILDEDGRRGDEFVPFPIRPREMPSPP